MSNCRVGSRNRWKILRWSKQLQVVTEFAELFQLVSSPLLISSTWLNIAPLFGIVPVRSSTTSILEVYIWKICLSYYFNVFIDSNGNRDLNSYGLHLCLVVRCSSGRTVSPSVKLSEQNHQVIGIGIYRCGSLTLLTHYHTTESPKSNIQKRIAILESAKRVVMASTRLKPDEDTPHVALKTPFPS